MKARVQYVWEKYWKLYTVLSYREVVYLCICCILRCLVCIVSCLVCIVSCLVCIVVVLLCVLLSFYVYLLYYMCIAVFTLDARLLARSQCSEGPATGHLDTGFFWFPCV